MVGMSSGFIPIKDAVTASVATISVPASKKQVLPCTGAVQSTMFRDGFICKDYIPGDVIQCYRPGLPSRRRVITVRRVLVLEDLIIAKKEGVIT